MQIPQLWSRAMRRILLAVLLLGAALGALEYWFEIERVDEEVVRLAKQEAHSFVDRFVERGALYDDLASVEADARHVLLDHFPVVEFYDLEQRKLLEVVAPDREWVEEKLKGRRHGFPSDNRPIYHRIDVDGQTFIQVVIPLQQGFFEGVFHVDEATLAEVRQAIYRAVVTVVLCVLITGLVLLPLLLGLNRELVRTSREILAGNIELMEVLGSAIAKRDSDTNAHNYRVTLYSIELARRAGLPDAQMRSLIAGAFLHDVGKIGIPDAILLKPGRLEPEEFEVMKEHVALGGADP